MLNRKIVLCSASPRRKQLLMEIGLAVKTCIKDIEENFSAHLREAEIAEFLAGKKLMHISRIFNPEKFF